MTTPLRNQGVDAMLPRKMREVRPLCAQGAVRVTGA